jgi:hypothetical protein
MCRNCNSRAAAWPARWYRAVQLLAKGSGLRCQGSMSLNGVSRDGSVSCGSKLVPAASCCHVSRTTGLRKSRQSSLSNLDVRRYARDSFSSISAYAGRDALQGVIRNVACSIARLADRASSFEALVLLDTNTWHCAARAVTIISSYVSARIAAHVRPESLSAKLTSQPLQIITPQRRREQVTIVG